MALTPHAQPVGSQAGGRHRLKGNSPRKHTQHTAAAPFGIHHGKSIQPPRLQQRSSRVLPDDTAVLRSHRSGRKPATIATRSTALLRRGRGLSYSSGVSRFSSSLTWLQGRAWRRLSQIYTAQQLPQQQQQHRQKKAPTTASRPTSMK